MTYDYLIQTHGIKDKGYKRQSSRLEKSEKGWQADAGQGGCYAEGYHPQICGESTATLAVSSRGASHWHYSAVSSCLFFYSLYYSSFDYPHNNMAAIPGLSSLFRGSSRALYRSRKPLLIPAYRSISTKHPKGFVAPTEEDLNELRERVQEFTSEYCLLLWYRRIELEMLNC